MSSPELELDAFDFPSTGTESLPEPRSAAALKQQVADRLAAHRSKRNRHAGSNLIPIPNLDPGGMEGKPSKTPLKAAPRSPATSGKSRAGRIAAAIAERYAHSTTYREFLAAEAERAIAAANATAEIAARNAEAVTVVQQQLLAELDLWHEPSRSQTRQLPELHPTVGNDAGSIFTPVLGAEPPVAPLDSGITVRLYEDAGIRQSVPRTPSASSLHDQAALSQLDEEIAFRQAPIFDEPASPPVPIPANLIAFPRQLVAARKSRPRIAEGPLREEADVAPASAQLRIFEVDASQFSVAPTVEPETTLPEWSSIHLGATPVILPELRTVADSTVSSEAQLKTQLYIPIQVAPLGDRLMAAVVDACLLGMTFLAAVTAFAYAVRSLPAAPIAAIASAVTLLVLFVLYHMLFFTFSCATPGMKYARIGLCTFSDDNPTRSEMRRRVWFILLGACPLGLGIFWSLLDEDTLSWHDRLSRIYQRSY